MSVTNPAMDPTSAARRNLATQVLKLRNADSFVKRKQTVAARASAAVDEARGRRIATRNLVAQATREAREAKVPWSEIEEITGFKRQYLDRLLREAS